MAGKIKLLCKSIMIKILSSLERFPVALLMATTTVGVLIFLNHLGYTQNNYYRELRDTLSRIAMIFALGIPAALCIKVFFERTNGKKFVKIGVYGGASLLLLLYYFFLPKELGMVAMTRYIAITISLYLTFTFIPYFYKKEDYELYVIKLITRFFITYLYSIVLYLGLIAILFTIKTLFTLGISDRLYFDIWLIVVGVFAPAFFLGEIPQYGAILESEEYPKVFKVLVLYIIMPLLTAYTLILYSYFVKVLITRLWPQGIISNLVLWYSVICTIIIFLGNPLVDKNQWGKMFNKILPKVILPLLGMMFISILMRINAYGVTENRYFVVVVGLWVTGSMLYRIIRKNPRNIVLSISIAIIAIVSVIGPISSYSISKYSQNMRFENLLNQNNLLVDGEIKGVKDLPEEAQKEISEVIIYFNSNHSLEDVKLLPEGFKIKDMEGVLGFPLRENSYHRDYFHYNIQPGILLYDIAEYDYFAQIDPYNAINNNTIHPFNINYNANGKTLLIQLEGKSLYTKSLEDVAADIHKKNKGDKTLLSIEGLTYTDENEKINVSLLFKQLSGTEAVDKFNLEHFDLYVFVKVKP